MTACSLKENGRDSDLQHCLSLSPCFNNPTGIKVSWYSSIMANVS